MTDTEIRIAVAEACGFVWYRHPDANSLSVPRYRFLALPAVQEFEQSPEWIVRADMTEKPCSVDYMAREFHIPNYPNDLNAMHEAEETLNSNQRIVYIRTLLKPANEFDACYNCLDNHDYMWALVNASAAERAKAFLRTLGKWKEKE